MYNTIYYYRDREDGTIVENPVPLHHPKLEFVKRVDIIDKVTKDELEYFLSID